MKKSSNLPKVISGVFSVVCLPAVALAADGHAPQTIASLFWPAANFCLYFIVIVTVLRKVGKPALINRAVSLEQRMKEATSLLVDAERELDVLRNRMENIEDEKSEIVRRLKDEGNSTAEQLSKNAEEAATLAEREMERRIASEESHAAAVVRMQVIEKATALARVKLVAAMSAEEDARLRREAIASLF